jgi:hypothetical protein
MELKPALKTMSPVAGISADIRHRAKQPFRSKFLGWALLILAPAAAICLFVLIVRGTDDHDW